MSEPNSPVENDQAVAKLNQIMTVFVGCLVLGGVGFFAYQNRSSLASSLTLPDRKNIWADALTQKIKISKDRGLPEFKPEYDTSKMQIDPAMLERMQSGVDPSMLQLNRKDTPHRSLGRR
jgi:hypothetical protein